MKSSYRESLPQGASLSLHPDGQPGQTLTFTIDRPIGQGGTALVYKATREDGVYGTLKVFCPAEEDWRPEDTQRLRQTCAALHRLKRQETLGLFIPYMALYLDGEDRPRLFTPEDRRGITLAQYLQELPPTPTAETLFQVLHAVHTTALAVWQLNEQNALLLDIKPDNILLLQRAAPTGESRYLQDSVSLFDIESLLPDYPTAAAQALLPFSPGFTAPELGTPWAMAHRRRIGPASDVYALAATLLFSLTGRTGPLYGEDLAAALRSGPFGALWQEADCRRMVLLLGQALEPNAFRRTPNASVFADRLQTVTELLQQRYALEKQAEDLQWQDRLPQMLTHLLYRWPCQDFAGDGPLRVGLVSDGNEAALLQALSLLVRSCQVLDRPLQILVVMPGARQLVRQWREELYQPETWLQWGEGPDFSPCDSCRYAAQIHWSDAAPDTVLAASARQAIPYWILLPIVPDTALAWAARWQPAGRPELLAYLCPQEAPTRDEAPDSLTRVPLRPFLPDDLFTEWANQVAYRAHALYERERDPRVSEATVRRTFAEGYNRAASLETALAVKCRLASAGVRWQQDAGAMVRAFRAALDADATLLPRLSWLEHRRWMLSKLVQGARPLTAEEFPLLLDGGAQRAGTHLRREGRLFHAYLVPSRWTPRPQGWQTAEEWARQPLDTPLPEELDELDRAGLTLYRMFAKEARNSHPEPMYRLVDSLSTQVGRWVEEHHSGEEAAPLYTARDRLGQALRALQDPGAESTTVEAFLSSLHDLEEQLQRLEALAPYAARARQTAALLEDACFCLLQSRRCIDPKRLDDTLIENIPLLLPAMEGTPPPEGRSVWKTP